ncbi:Sucrase/ferredoxin-like-domain-containing protein [Scheffersomyces xylosifermentans]|uniref:Sucrase/ferredoxin-like-domain-containing protein n=1 Tax=Scheffersomyces xylosifermentans TaxID=1304137 RepID=UPI00315DD5A8
MGLLNTIFNRGGHDSQKLKAEIESKGFEVSDCSFECDDCTSHFPKSIKVEEDADLWESTKPFGLHIVVPTGKTDWPHDACGSHGTFSHKVSGWASDNSGKYPEIGNIKVTVSSLSSDALYTDDDYINEKKGDILLLPFFVWAKGVELKEVAGLLSAVIPDLVASRSNKASGLELSYPQFPNVKLSVDNNQSYVFFCSHRTRDKRCGITAPIMKKEMELHLRELGLYRDYGDNSPGGVQVAFINHIGGHKFVANVIIYLKQSGKIIWLARCRPSNVKAIVDECIVKDGKVRPDKIRIIQKFDPIEW